MIYFDNAATTGKKPQNVILAVNTALTKFCANPGRSGHSISLSAAEQIYKTRSKIANFFGVQNAESVIFTANCTESLNFVIKGVLKAGDTVVVSARSIGSANVQMILEPLGGGGNTATAGAQMHGVTIKDALDRLVASIDDFYKE